MTALKTPSVSTASGTTVGIVADPHCDHEALAAAIAHLRNMGCQKIICAGDVADPKAAPVDLDKTIAVLRESDIPCVLGNHDDEAAKDGRLRTGPISAEARQYLRGLPDYYSIDVDGLAIRIQHKAPDWKEEICRAFVEEHRIDILIVGHVNSSNRVKTLTESGCQMVTVGSTAKRYAHSFATLALPARTVIFRDVATGHPVTQTGLRPTQ
jgi:predicted phosphodiesterase